MGVSISGIKSQPGRIHIFGGSNSPSEPETQGGSLYFAADSWLAITPESPGDMFVGAGDFTVEWFQYQTAQEGTYTRIFSQGNWPEAEFAVSVEPAGEAGPGFGVLYLWGLGGEAGVILSLPITDFADKWTHFAIVRAGSTITAYQDGIEIGFTTNSSEIGDSTGTVPFIIGNELADPLTTQFYGNLTNFHLVIGVALYNGNFTPPFEPLSAVEGTSILMISYSEPNAFNESMGHTIENAGGTPVVWQSLSPFPL